MTADSVTDYTMAPNMEYPICVSEAGKFDVTLFTSPTLNFVPDRGTERIGILRGIQIHHDGGVSITGDPFLREECIRHHGRGEIEKSVIGMRWEDFGLVFCVIHMIWNIAQSEDRCRYV